MEQSPTFKARAPYANERLTIAARGISPKLSKHTEKGAVLLQLRY